MRRKKQKQVEPTIQLSHKIALVPTGDQESYFKKACGTARFTWNWALAEWIRQFDEGLKPDATSLKKAFNAIKYQEFPWLSEIHRDAHAEPFTNLSRAWLRFFKNCKSGQPAHAPVFKRKGKSRDSFYVANDKFRVDGETITLPIVGKVKMREELRFKGKLLGATVSRSADRWFVAIQVEMPAHKTLRKRTGDAVEGVDLGITSAVTLSTGEKIESPRPLRSAMRRLKIRGRRVSRKLDAAKIAAGIKLHGRIPKGTRLPLSNNRRKASLSLSKTHYRVACIRNDFSHKLTDRLCRKNQAVGMEDLNVRGMLSNHNIAMAISDIGFGEIKRQMKYKSLLYGSKVVEADRWFPSSKMCHVCGHVVKELPLSIREWICPDCGGVHDRDVNAAKNLKRLATETALPVARTTATSFTFDEVSSSDGGKVTPVRITISVLKRDRGRKKRQQGDYST